MEGEGDKKGKKRVHRKIKNNREREGERRKKKKRRRERERGKGGTAHLQPETVSRYTWVSKRGER